MILNEILASLLEILAFDGWCIHLSPKVDFTYQTKIKLKLSEGQISRNNKSIAS